MSGFVTPMVDDAEPHDPHTTFQTPAVNDPYPDMTPGPSNIMKRGAAEPPPDPRPGGSLWDANVRVGTEIRRAFRDTPGVDPVTRNWLENQGWLGRNVLAPASDVADFAVRGASAAGAGVLANLSELLAAGDPQKARDYHALLTILPVAQAHMPPVAGPVVPRREPLTGGEPAPSVPVRTPEDALTLSQPFYKRTETANFQLKPEFSNEWVDSLDTYQPQTPAGAATARKTNAVTELLTDLKNAKDAPLDSIKSIQEVDQNIQAALSKEYGPNGLSPEGRQIREILQDFRAKYENVPDNMFNGDPTAIQDFRNGMKGYAAYSRMRELQGVVDSTEGNPNRATLIASRVNAFLSNKKNVRGWTDAEIKSARDAANSGFIQEWMRAEGSRLLGIGVGVTTGLGGSVLAVPAQVGISYAIRNAAENMRLSQLQKALETLGQRVPQPGTVPPPPPPYMPPRSLVSSARYAPLVGLLGQQQDNQ